MENKKYDDLLESFMTNANDVDHKSNNVSTSYKKEKPKAYFSNENKEKKSTKYKLKKIGIALLNLILVFFLVLELYGEFSAKYPEKIDGLTSTIESTFNKPNESQTHDWSVENNIDTLYNIQPEIWETLTDEQKINTIDNLMNMELYNLGVTSPVKLIVKNISGTALGKHHQNLNLIEIDKYHLLNDSVYDVVTTVCHECRHAYQYDCVIAYDDANRNFKNLEMYDNAEQFKENFANYIEFKWNEEDSYDQYASQIVESDASQYAAVQTDNYYYNLIPKYIESE